MGASSGRDQKSGIFNMLAKRVEKLFNIHPGEQRMAALVFSYAILLSASTVLAVTASLGLFFEAYDAATLPYTYVLLMFVGPLVSFVYLRLNSRLSLSKSLLAIHTLLLLSLILLPLILSRSDARFVVFILPVYVEVNYILTGASYWNLLGRIYNLREGKRLFPILSSGEHLATIGAGFLATFFIAGIGTVNLFWLAALFMVAAIGLLVVINRANEEKMGNDPADKAADSSESGLKTLVREPFVRLLFAVVSLYTIGVIMVDYLAFAEAEIRFPTAEEMATYVALFMGVYGVLGLIVQWLIAGRVLDRFGVSTTLLSLPGGLFIFMAFFALVGSISEIPVALFWLSTGANMYAYMLDAPFSAARNVMLQPLPIQLRTQAQTTAIGIAYPLASGLSGLLLLFLLNVLGFSSVQLSFVILVVLALWLAAGSWLGRAYVRRLRQALLARSLGGLGLFRSADRSTISVLEEALSSPQPAAVLFALDRLTEIAPEALPRRLPGLLLYPDDGVRLAALQQIGGFTWPETPGSVTALLEESPNPEVRAAALRMWYATNPRQASPSLDLYSHDPQENVRQAALVLMCRDQNPALHRQGMEILDNLVNSEVPSDQILAAEVIAEIDAEEETGKLLLKLLAEDDPRVQQAGLVAATKAGHPATWPAIIPYLAQAKSSSLAAGTLVAGGQEVLLLLQAACLEPDQDPRILAGLALVCGRIAGPAAIEILASLLDHPEADVRRQVMLGLSHSGYRAEPLQRAEIKERLHLQAVVLAEIIAAQVDIQGSGNEEQAQELHLVGDALAQRQQVETDNLLLLLSFLDEPQIVLSAREALQPGRSDEEKSAYAIETLDILLDHADKRLLFPFLQHLEPEQRLARLPKRLPYVLLGREQRLNRLLETDAQGGERWLRICAIHTLGLLGAVGAAQAIIDTTIGYDDDAVLVETALNSLEQLGLSLEVIAVVSPAFEASVGQWQSRESGKMTLLQKADSLKQVNIFAVLPSAALENAAGSMEVVNFKAGETIIQKGDQGDCLYTVLEGQLRIHDNGQSIKLLDVGGVVGEMALLDAQPRSASVTAVTDSRLLQLKKDSFDELLMAYPQVARELLILLSRRLRERMADLAPTTPQEALHPGMPVTGGKKGIGMNAALAGAPVGLNKLFTLKSTRLFGGLDNNLLEQVAGLLDEVDLTGGETLFYADDLGYSLYIVAMGQVWVHIAERTLAYRGEDEVIGEMALLESKLRSATVTAVMPTQLLRLDQQPFFELLEVQPKLAREMIKMLSGRLRTHLQESAVRPEDPEPVQ